MDTWAQTRIKRAKTFLKDAIFFGSLFDLDPYLILGMIERESNFGASLDSDGWGDNGNAFGVLQVDKRFHKVVTEGGPAGHKHFEQALGILNSNKILLPVMKSKWTKDEVIKGALVAYNSGLKNVVTQPSNADKWRRLDIGTTGNNYSQDIFDRMKFFRNHFINLEV